MNFGPSWASSQLGSFCPFYFIWILICPDSKVWTSQEKFVGTQGKYVGNYVKYSGTQEKEILEIKEIFLELKENKNIEYNV